MLDVPESVPERTAGRGARSAERLEWRLCHPLGELLSGGHDRRAP
jgi:hypothetical protein